MAAAISVFQFDRSPNRLRTIHRHRSRPSMSRASSISLMSAPPTPSRGITPFFLPADVSTRSASPALSFTQLPPSESSAKFHLHETKASVPFQGHLDDVLGPTSPLAWTPNNALVFGRGDRVHVKNLATTGTDDVAVLVKLKDHHGHLRLLECGDDEMPNVVAVATSKGLIQLWDIPSKKMVMNWYTKPVSALRFAGPILSYASLLFFAETICAADCRC
ncbi:hypothetical protein OF83DRAFT_1294868 [Amylostereum chailletii]|nr:hypothetical protein OF83DRAFT_1294868 [Amylostereum chailletii]